MERLLSQRLHDDGGCLDIAESLYCIKSRDLHAPGFNVQGILVVSSEPL
jgi:hypothetical protein